MKVLKQERKNGILDDLQKVFKRMVWQREVHSVVYTETETSACVCCSWGVQKQKCAWTPDFMANEKRMSESASLGES